MDRVEILREQQTAAGWTFTVRVRGAGGAGTHAVTLSWADHDHWTGGSVAPQRLAEAAVRLAIEGLESGQRLPESFDVSTVARRIPGFAERLKASL